MRVVLVAFVALFAGSLCASAGGMDRVNTSHHGRAFWLDNQAWPTPSLQPGNAPAPLPYPMTYSDEVAASLGVANGRLDVFNSSLNGPGEAGPTLGGTVDGGAAKLVLRWHPDE